MPNPPLPKKRHGAHNVTAPADNTRVRQPNRNNTPTVRARPIANREVEEYFNDDVRSEAIRNMNQASAARDGRGNFPRDSRGYVSPHRSKIEVDAEQALNRRSGSGVVPLPEAAKKRNALRRAIDRSRGF